MDSEELDEITYEFECSNCEAIFSIVLNEEFLKEEVAYCPFCGEYQIED